MIRAVHTLTHLLPAGEDEKPHAVAIAAAMGRTPHAEDLNRLAPPRGVMLPFPPADGTHDADMREAAAVALASGGTAVAFTRPHLAAEAERWLREAAEGARHG
ncbi:hypothetical protein ACE7GA_21350 [Roseomonas sp. CCTCC AB2023176]|uniref:hypothetical protein n=1 Tax=Roseomonas sp. CCTCC AB2023176 TaxID=3342640 RepID=UPI0035E1628E